MNTDHHPLFHQSPTEATSGNAWTYALVWTSLVISALLFAGFTAFVNDITERGEQRRMQQRASGSLLLPSASQAQDLDMAYLLSITGEKLAGR